MEEPLCGRPVEILLVEDSPAAAQFVRDAMLNAKVYNHLTVVSDGVEAMAFLRGEGCYASAPRPDLILLDLNLPRKDGRAVLAEIKADPVLEPIPVVILTASEAEEDIVRAYHLQASAYMTKPVTPGQLVRAVRSIQDFGLTIVKVPSVSEAEWSREATP